MIVHDLTKRKKKLTNGEKVCSSRPKMLLQAGLKKAGFGAQEFSDMLNGRKLIKMCDVLKIAKALNVTPNDLYGIPVEEAS